MKKSLWNGSRRGAEAQRDSETTLRLCARIHFFHGNQSSREQNGDAGKPALL